MGITVIMVSHDTEATLKYASHILHLSHDKIFYGTKDEFMHSEDGMRLHRERGLIDMEIFADMFNYQFMVRAITVGLLVSLCASLLGVSMVLKRYSMIGDGLSHVGFAALAAAAAAGTAPLKVAIPVCIAAAFLC